MNEPPGAQQELISPPQDLNLNIQMTLPHFSDFFVSSLMRFTRFHVIFGLLMLVAASADASGNRFALVIGNQDYAEGRLKNPANDARVISKALADLGFDVETKIDLDQQAMESAISSFGRRLPQHSVAFFFFAGHGIQANGMNYLIPIGATLESESALKYKTVALDYVRDELSDSQSSLKVMVLDCCRNNPFERSWNRSLAERGMAPVQETPDGTIIAYSAADGKTAADGVGENSPYTSELSAALASRPAEGLTLFDGVFRRLGQNMKEKLNQRPHLYFDSTLPQYYLWKPDDFATSVSSKMELPLLSEANPSSSLPTAKSETPSAETYRAQNRLLDQAYTFHGERQFDLAIEAFTSLITDPEITSEIRNQARRGRGSCYLSQGTSKSINMAIIDFQAAKEPGVQLSVKTSDAELKVGSETKGKLFKNEIAMLTKSQGNWLWVEAVQGDKSRQGWVDFSAFLSTTTPASSTTASSKPTTQPLSSTSSVQPSNSSQRIVGYDQYGRPRYSSGSGSVATNSSSQGRYIQPTNQNMQRQSSSSSGDSMLGDLSTQSHKDLSQLRRDLDREVREYQAQGGRLTADERRQLNQMRGQIDREKGRAFWQGR